MRDIILFHHHKPLDEPVTKRHLVLFKSLNPNCDVLPQRFKGDGARMSVDWQRHNHDLPMYDWYDRERPVFYRLFLVEYDTFSTTSLRDFFGPAYVKKSAGATIIRPWSDEVVPTDCHGFKQRQRDWHWFTENRSEKLHPFLRGMTPASVVMFAHETLHGMNELYRTVPEFKDMHCELRMGTLSAMAGYEPSEIRPDCWKFIHSNDVDIDQGPGVYHRVRC